MNRRSVGNLLELLFITAVVLLFGLTTYTLVTVGGENYNRIIDKRDQNNDARVALSYMTTRIRQSDSSGGVSLREYDGIQVLSLAFSDEEGYRYETRVYCHDGTLWEALVPADAAFDPLAGEAVVPLQDLRVSYIQTASGRPDVLRLEVWPVSDGDEFSMFYTDPALQTTLALQSV